jgi:ubiquinone/menaquinone biosynthesis C-methylase UbiE
MKLPEKTTLNIIQLRELVSAFQKSRIVLTAFELGIFTSLGNEFRTSFEVAHLLNSRPRATDRLMNALCSLGLLNKENNLFSNTEMGKQFLVNGAPDYQSGLNHSLHLWNSWSQLTEVIQTGKPAADKVIGDRGQNWVEGFIEAMNNRGKMIAPQVIEQLDFTKVKRVLDIGGGSGIFTITMVKSNPGLEGVVFDIPEVVPLTNKYIAAAGLTNRITTMSGDMKTSEFGQNFDMIFLSAIIHMLSPSECQQLINKCSKALNSGGQLVIRDYLMDDTRTEPTQGAIFAINMLVGTDEGDTYTENEVKDWMKNAGFVEFRRFDPMMDSAVMIGYKL